MTVEESTGERRIRRTLWTIGTVLVLWCGIPLAANAYTDWAAGRVGGAGTFTIARTQPAGLGGCDVWGSYSSHDGTTVVADIGLWGRVAGPSCPVGTEVHAVHLAGRIVRLADASAEATPPGDAGHRVAGLLVGAVLAAYGAMMTVRNRRNRSTPQLNPLRALRARRAGTRHWSEQKPRGGTDRIRGTQGVGDDAAGKDR